MPGKRGTSKAQPSVRPVPSQAAPPGDGPVGEAAGEREPVAAAAGSAAEVAGEPDEQAPPEPANRAERRAMAKGRAARQPVSKVKQFGRGAPAGQTPRRWQGRRGG